MVGWHHWFKGHEFEQTPGDSEGQGSLVCYSPWGHKESDMIEQFHNNNDLDMSVCVCVCVHSVAQSYPTLCNHMVCSPPGSSVLRVF